VRILVAFAMADEFAPWRRLRDFRPSEPGAIEAYTAEIGGAEVAVVLTGVGPQRAAAAAASAMRGNPSSIGCCISSGVAGALRAEYGIGRILAARGVISEAVPRANSAASLECSEPLISFAADCGATVVSRFYSAGRIISTAEDKKHLATSADAVEMESFAILRQAREAAIPAVAIRAVSDVATEDLPLDMNDILSRDGEVSMPRVLGQVALHPFAVPGLLRFARSGRQAAASLARFLDRYVGVVAEHSGALETKTAAARPY
jgi:adenosylhomocysteine nucleosidase